MSNSCENTYNAIGLSCGMSGEEARRMVEYWKSPRLPSDYWREQCDILKQSVKEQTKVIIEKENEVSSYRVWKTEVCLVSERVLEGLDWDSNMPVDIHQMHCINLWRLIHAGVKKPELMAPEDRNLNNPWIPNEQEQEG